jgi:hypothetical protein
MRRAAAATAVCCAFAVLIACAGEPAGRLGGALSPSPTEVSIPGTGRVSPTPSESPEVIVTQAPRVAENAQQSKVCKGEAAAFIPATLPGYTVAASSALAAQVPAGQPGVESVSAAAVTRQGGGVGAITAIVFQEQSAGSQFVQTAIDAALKAAAAGGQVEEVSLAGFRVFRVTNPSSTTYGWQSCQNVVLLVNANLPDMAVDVTTKILAPR